MSGVKSCDCYSRAADVPESKTAEASNPQMIDDLNGDGTVDRIATYVDTRYTKADISPENSVCLSSCSGKPLHPTLKRVEFGDPNNAGSWLKSEELTQFIRSKVSA